MGMHKRSLPEECRFATFVDEGPDQEDDVFTGWTPTFLTLAAQVASLALFIGMVAVWAAIFDGRFPEVPQ